MNTMYREQEDQRTGYEQVKKVFANNSPGILSAGNFNRGEAEASQADQIIAKLYKEDDVQIITKLNAAADAIADEEWPDAKKSLDESDGIKRAPFDLMPKALLHVHSKVGLSADQLYELIGEINEGETEDEKKIGFAVEEDKETGTVKTVRLVLYKKQFELLKDKMPDVKFEEFDSKNGYKQYLQFDKKPDKEAAWTDFNGIYVRMEPLFQIKEFYAVYHEKLFALCGENHIHYVELRVGFEELVDLDDWKPETLVSLREGFRLEDYFYHKDMMLSAAPNEPKAEFLQIILEAAERSSLGKENVKVILTANRNPRKKEPEALAENRKKICFKLDTAIAIKNGMADAGEQNSDIADMVIGFDLVNQEMDNVGLTDDYASILYGKFGESPQVQEALQEENVLEYKADPKFDKLKDKSRISLIRFFLHDGESISKIEAVPGAGIRDNAVTGPVCSRHRIGHGFKMGASDNFNPAVRSDTDRKSGNLISDYILYGCNVDIGKPEEPYPVKNYPVKIDSGKYIREDAVPEPVMELCPISNYMLNYTDSFLSHPAISLMQKGVLAVICNDDPQIFDNPGLSYDYAVMYAALKEQMKGEEDNEKPYKLLKLSAFLGFFYQEMSKYYYRKQEDLWLVNDGMAAGDSGGSMEGSEYSIFNKAVEAFNDAWKAYGETFVES